jgi:hypothetical protein
MNLRRKKSRRRKHMFICASTEDLGPQDRDGTIKNFTSSWKFAEHEFRKFCSRPACSIEASHTVKVFANLFKSNLNFVLTGALFGLCSQAVKSCPHTLTI